MNQNEVKTRLKDIMEHPSYRLAYLDFDYLQREDLRPLRLELELLKPEMLTDEAGVNSTIVVFGGTLRRFRRPRERAAHVCETHPNNGVRGPPLHTLRASLGWERSMKAAERSHGSEVMRAPARRSERCQRGWRRWRPLI